MKKQFIRDLKPGTKVSGLFAVAKYKQLEYFRDKSKGRYLTIVLADRSGRIRARAWENADALYQRFEEDDIIGVWGRVEEYLGRPQIVVEKLRPAKPEEKDTHFSEDDFVPQTDKDIPTLWAEVQTAVQTMTNPYLKRLGESILADTALAAGLQAAPASKAMHHSYRGGLLEHIVEMLRLAATLSALYPQVDIDLLKTGIIVHDLGLVEGTRYTRQIDYSDAGRLLGHLVLGERLVAEHIAAINDFPAELALRLSHMILSHHGAAEHGAVREPQTLEATALFLVNKLSADLHHVQQVLDSQWDDERPWTDFDRLWGRSFFRGGPLEATTPGPSETASAPGPDAGEAGTSAAADL